MFNLDEFSAAVLTDFPKAWVYEQVGLVFVQLDLAVVQNEFLETVIESAGRWNLALQRWSVRSTEPDKSVLTAVFLPSFERSHRVEFAESDYLDFVVLANRILRGGSHVFDDARQLADLVNDYFAEEASE